MEKNKKQEAKRRGKKGRPQVVNYTLEEVLSLHKQRYSLTTIAEILTKRYGERVTRKGIGSRLRRAGVKLPLLGVPKMCNYTLEEGEAM